MPTRGGGHGIYEWGSVKWGSWNVVGGGDDKFRESQVCAQASIRDRPAWGRPGKEFDGRSIHKNSGRPSQSPVAMPSESSAVANGASLANVSRIFAVSPQAKWPPIPPRLSPAFATARQTITCLWSPRRRNSWEAPFCGNTRDVATPLRFTTFPRPPRGAASSHGFTRANRLIHHFSRDKALAWRGCFHDARGDIGSQSGRADPPAQFVADEIFAREAAAQRAGGKAVVS